MNKHRKDMINRIVRALQQNWTQHPHMRLGQLIINTLPEHEIFYGISLENIHRYIQKYPHATVKDLLQSGLIEGFSTTQSIYYTDDRDWLAHLRQYPKKGENNHEPVVLCDEEKKPPT